MALLLECDIPIFQSGFCSLFSVGVRPSHIALVGTLNEEQPRFVKANVEPQAFRHRMPRSITDERAARVPTLPTVWAHQPVRWPHAHILRFNMNDLRYLVRHPFSPSVSFVALRNTLETWRFLGRCLVESKNNTLPRNACFFPYPCAGKGITGFPGETAFPSLNVPAGRV